VYRPGDYVYLADLPRPLLCRVKDTESSRTRTGRFQILTLKPLEGPWLEWPDLQLVRLDEAVEPARARDLWRARVA
jgi:hypothetical protein